MRHCYRAIVKHTALCLAFGWTLSACQTTAVSGPVYRLQVERGDTLAAIARKYDTTWERIARLNHLPPGRPLVVGSVLKVAPGPGGLVAAAEPDGPDEDDDESVSSSAGGEAEGGLLFGGGRADSHRSVRSSLDWPLYGLLSSSYGMRHGRFHHGIDIRAKVGSPVLAAAPGVVEFAGRQHGYGNVVIVRHKQVKTIYGHLRSVNVAVGSEVDRTSEIGRSGQSGNSTGPHLHFEIRDLSNHSVDPLSVIAKEKLLSSRR